MTGSTSSGESMRGKAHLVVRASAGTGKTFTLSNRYLKLLRLGATPDAILATTFTRKAAGEILGRVLTRLAEAAHDVDAAEQLGRQLSAGPFTLDDARRMLRELAHGLHRVSICTIDSFFNRVVQCFRHELDVPPNVALVAESDPAAVQLRAQAIEAMLADDDPQVLIELLRRLHHDQAQRSVGEAIDQIVTTLHDAYRQAPQEAWRVLSATQGLPRDELTDALIAMRGLADQLPKGERWAKAWRTDRESAEAGRWSDFIAGGLTKAIVERGALYYGKPVPPAVVDAYQPLVAHAQGEVIGRVARRTEAMHQLMQRFDSHDTRLRRRHNVMLFSDLPRKLAHELPNLGDDLQLHLQFRLDTQVAHLLLDEFQDTSVEQWSVLRPFAEEIRAHGDPDDPLTRTFFCVGDVKQAIYGWRGGCAEILDQVELDLQLEKDHGDTLSKSYRSSPVVLDAVNTVFADLDESPPLAEHGDDVAAWLEGYTPHTANFEDLPGYVELITSPGQGEQTNAHERYAAQLVADLTARAGGLSIGVLVRTNKTANALLYELRRLRVPASGEGGSPVTDDPAVNAVLAALTLADHPGHTAAAFHVANSPIGEVLGLKSTGANQAADLALGVRRQLLEEGYGPTVTEWARRLAPSCDARGVARLTQLIDLADRYDPSITLRTSDFVDYVQGSMVDEPATAPVRVMTVHKAKGLEFDIVVLAELSPRMGRSHGQVLWSYHPHPTDAPTAVFASGDRSARAVIEAHCPLYTQAYEQEQGRRLRDDLSGLYVAMTRARHALHMVVPPLSRTQKGVGAAGWTDPSAASVLRHALSTLGDGEKPAGMQTLFSQGDPDWPRSPRAPQPKKPVVKPADGARPAPVTFADDGAAARRSWRSVTPSSLEADGRVRAADLLSIQPNLAAKRGEVMHAWLADIDWLDDADAAIDTDALLAAARRNASTVGDDRLHEWSRQFQAIIKQPTVRRVLARPTVTDDTELWRERSFAVRDDDRLLHGVFDRVVIRRAGGVVAGVELIDFKTDHVDEDRSNLEGLVERYRPQINAYAEALTRLLGVARASVSASLLFLASDDQATIQPGI